MTTPSHQLQAEELLKSVERNGGNDKAHLAVILAQAQVHATLAMVEVFETFTLAQQKMGKPTEPVSFDAIVNRDNPHFIYGSNACSGELVDFRIADGDGSLEVLREKLFDYALHSSGEIHAYEDSLTDTQRTYPNDNSISADCVAITGWDSQLSKTEHVSALDCFNL